MLLIAQEISYQQSDESECIRMGRSFLSIFNNQIEITCQFCSEYFDVQVIVC